MSALLAFLIRIGFGGMADRAIRLIETRAAASNDRAAIHAQTTAELARAAVEEARIMTEFNKAKLSFPWFWIMAAMFVVPLAIWWAAVILDSIFLFGWRVADLPTPQMQQWAGDMIQWLFYVGSGVGAIKAVQR
ncbi:MULTISPECIES: hypothetical protein [unclassified Yoonia]|uniref:hypothetical protein n=1 Tax=unclassified Yoonia TaxID=2629118 RepID=UPI002AFE39D8|nr:MULTISPECIES: hypothetical protein [unclassified Yoonia]